MKQKKYWLEGLLIGAKVGIILYVISVAGIYFTESCYKYPYPSDGKGDVMCGFATLFILMYGWIWIVVGLLVGAIIGLFHKHFKIVIPIMAFILLVPIGYLVYNNYIRERHKIDGEVQIHNDGSKFIYRNGQWQSY